MFFTLDILYRFAEFDAHVIELETGPSSTMSTLLNGSNETGIPYIEYEVTQVGISGLALRGGIKFRF